MRVYLKKRITPFKGSFTVSIGLSLTSFPYSKYIVYLLFLLPLCPKAQGYDHPDKEIIKEFVTKVSSIYGVDDELINGYPYQPPDKAIKSHPYFVDSDWVSADLYMNGEAYLNKKIKYDISKDAMILKAELENGVSKLIHLNSLYVDSLKMRNRLFTHSRKYFPPDSIETYFEEIFLSDDKRFGLIIHYSKNFLSQFTQIAPRGRFSDTDENKWVLIEGRSEKVNRRRSFLKLFDNEKRGEIKKFMNKENIKYRKANQNQLKKLMKFCSVPLMSN